MKNKNEPLLRLEKVSKYYSTAGNLALGLHNVSLSMSRGEIIAVTGQSGSGKSTFLNVITGVDTYEDGEIYFNGETTSYFSKKDMEEYRKHNVGFIYQNYNLVESYTVLENVILPFILKGENDKLAKSHALEIISRVGLSSRVNHRATKLSGGEKQRTVIARAIASDSPILACDEPTGNLDSKTGKEIINLIKEVSENRLVLIVTHDYSSVSEIATRRIRFSDGDLVEDVKIKENSVLTKEINTEGSEKLIFKEGFKLAIKNLIRTPKKTILALFVFMICALVVFGNYATLTTNYRNSYDFFNPLLNATPSRALIYNENKEEIDYDLIKKNVETTVYDNSFVLDMISKNNNFLLTPYIPKSTDINGRLPMNDSECVYINSQLFSAFSGVSSSSNYSIGDKIKFYNELNNNESYIELTVVGVAEGTFKKGMLYAPLLYDNYRDLIISENVSPVFLENNKINSKIVIQDITSDKKFIVGYDENYYSLEDMKKHPISLSIAGYSFNLDESEIEFRPSITSDYSKYPFYLYTSNENLVETFSNHVFQVDTLTNQKYSLNDLKKDLSGQDVVVKSPSDYGTVELTALIDTVVNFLLIFNLIIILLIVYLISYFVLSKIYRTKNKDYTMIRSLGASKKDMARVVRFETVILSSIGSIIVMIVGFILASTTSIAIFNAFNNLDLYAYFLYVVLMGLFGVLMAGRFNQKLFKYSVNENLKKGELNND